MLGMGPSNDKYILSEDLLDVSRERQLQRQGSPLGGGIEIARVSCTEMTMLPKLLRSPLPEEMNGVKTRRPVVLRIQGIFL